jgi:hypothetical protein
MGKSTSHSYPREVIESAKANGWTVVVKKNGNVCFRHADGAVVWGGRHCTGGPPLENLLSRLRRNMTPALIPQRHHR